VRTLWTWLNGNSGAVQAIAAMVTGLLTLVLAGITWWYVRLTNASLALAREQFERQWRPFIAIKFVYLAPYKVELVVHNFGNSSVVVSGVLVWPQDVADEKPGNYLIDQPVDTHQKERVPIDNFLVDALKPNAGATERFAQVKLGVDYYALGSIGRVAYVKYAIRIAHNQVTEVIPITVVPTLD
jgi:hypothetical protein